MFKQINEGEKRDLLKVVGASLRIFEVMGSWRKVKLLMDEIDVLVIIEIQIEFDYDNSRINDI